ncbi:hydrolase [Antarcticibacterium flavum]|uniref:Hydrolase n=1 Tax=Antarcticibacterium flavum TaxID=2058175 RepID=A0A5B7X5K4_9FLAO|nr:MULTISPECIES: hydrolase [Antarcticibacterium]MCM4160049.1 hydrolase [Antarcticibacterium sp. W02-3]QCY70365.1 hydrolase [Antarcticibacterium flavum]
MIKILTIAVDFDGTIVENKYPAIGKPVLFAFETLQKLQEEGHHLILWTYRSGRELEEAVNFCRNKGIEFYAVNKSYPEEIYDEGLSRKIQADIFIDDRNFGGLKGWGEIYHSLSTGTTNSKTPNLKRKNKSLIDFLKIKL